MANDILKRTLPLKLALIIAALPVAAAVVSLIIWLPGHPANPEYRGIIYPIVAGLILSAIPFFVSLWQAFRLLLLIDRREAFSDQAVGGLGRIKVCALIITGIYAVLLPFFYMLAQKDDAPGIMLIGLVITLAAIVIAGFAWLLETLLKEAILIKTENDLTV